MVRGSTHLTHLVDGSARAPMKGVASSDIARVDVMQSLIRAYPNGTSCRRFAACASMRRGNLPNGNIQVGRGKEIKRDSPSTGEGRGNRPNRILERRTPECVGFGPRVGSNLTSRSVLESTAIEGDGPVREVKKACLGS